MSIKIREFDNTTAALGEYSNFAVVIPGPVGIPGLSDEIVAKKFDANDVCECHTQKDFENYIGFNGSGLSEKVARICATVKNWGTAESPVYYKVLTAEEIAMYPGQIYDCASVGPGAIGEDEGRLVWTDGTSFGYRYTLVASPVAGTNYSVIETGNEGEDAKIVNVPHYGNQMAYEMLGLGYTVLYKKAESVSDLGKEIFWSVLNDKSNYDFRFVVSGFINTPETIEDAICSFTRHDDSGAKRNDCCAIIDIPDTCYTGAYKTQEKAIEKMIEFLNSRNEEIADRNTSYIAPFISYNLARTKVQYTDRTGATVKYTDKFGASPYKFPGAFHYLICAAKSVKTFAEWYAVAGYNRGICDFEIEGAGIRFGDAAVSALQPRIIEDGEKKPKRAANLIINVRGQQILWGNRTAAKLSATEDLTAKHFLNIRQICYTIKKQVYLACKQLIFDPNSDVLWINFQNKVRPILEKMKADQGIKDYEFVEKTTNDQGIAERGKMYGIIRIVPIEAVEDFEIDLYLEDSLATEE